MTWMFSKYIGPFETFTTQMTIFETFLQLQLKNRLKIQQSFTYKTRRIICAKYVLTDGSKLNTILLVANFLMSDSFSQSRQVRIPLQPHGLG